MMRCALRNMRRTDRLSSIHTVAERRRQYEVDTTRDGDAILASPLTPNPNSDTEERALSTTNDSHHNSGDKIMRHRTKFASTVLLVIVCGSNPSLLYAEQFMANVYGSTTISELEKLMTMKEYDVAVDEEGDIEWNINGYKAWIEVFDGGKSLLFHTGFVDTETTLRHVNDWNRDNRFSRSYISDDGDPILELDLDLDGGVTLERMYLFLEMCRSQFVQWENDAVR